MGRGDGVVGVGMRWVWVVVGRFRVVFVVMPMIESGVH